eukprot:12649404-Ditylum_brightwellii.AAC.1
MAIHLPEIYGNKQWVVTDNKSSILSVLRSILCRSREKSTTGQDLHALNEQQEKPCAQECVDPQNKGAVRGKVCEKQSKKEQPHVKQSGKPKPEPNL